MNECEKCVYYCICLNCLIDNRTKTAVVVSIDRFDTFSGGCEITILCDNDYGRSNGTTSRHGERTKAP